MAGFMPPVTVDLYSTRSTLPVGMPARRASKPCGAFGSGVVCATRAAAYTVQPTIAATGGIHDRILAMSFLLINVTTAVNQCSVEFGFRIPMKFSTDAGSREDSGLPGLGSQTSRQLCGDDADPRK